MGWLKIKTAKSKSAAAEPKEEPLKFKTPLGRVVGARLFKKEPEVLEQVVSEVGRGILLAAGGNLAGELAKLAKGGGGEERTDIWVWSST